MAELITSSADLARWIAAQLPGPDDPDTPWCTDPDPAPDAPTALVRISVAVTDAHRPTPGSPSPEDRGEADRSAEQRQ
ncbi:hypothetical protein [Nocardia sp. NPDC050435]|uniref:hypothetical protein n=1 Tax=Nocardia sp. NPDC050435 TaxID=3155040 RepID=UPI0033C81517